MYRLLIIGDHERYYSFAEHDLFRYEPDLMEDIAESEVVRESNGAYGASEISVADPADAAESTDAEKNGKPDWMTARQQAIREITEKLKQGVKDLFDSEKYREYLNTMSKFHNYSLNNTILIAMQKPEATLVAGYTAWQKNHDRHVLKGEKGIKILAPAPYKVKLEQDRMDPDTHQPVFDAAGQPVKELIEVERSAFKVATVFDVSQTEGKEIPSIGVDELSGNVAQFAAFFEALKRTCPVKLEFEDIQSGAKGFYNLIEDRLIKKVLLLPVMVLIQLARLACKVAIDLSSYVTGPLLLFVAGCDIFCLVKQNWRGVLILTIIVVGILLLLFFVAFLLVKLANVVTGIRAFLNHKIC